MVKTRKQYMRAYCAARYHRRRRVAILFLLIMRGNDGCALCDGPGPFVIDHVDPATKTDDPSRLLTRPLRALWRELRGCQALCGACNYEKMKRDGAELRREWWARRRAA